jgi:prepilin-type processing-associated H-X9-DG protein
MKSALQDSVESPSTKIFIVDGVFFAGGAADQYPYLQDYCTEADSFPGAVPYTTEGGTSTTMKTSTRHSEGFNALWADGHVKWIKFGSSNWQNWAIQAPPAS